MSLRPIRLLGDPVLRTPAVPVTTFDKELRTLVKDLTDTMLEAPGVGLAANQVGVPLQVAVIEVEERVIEIVNPEIVRATGEQLDWEGCLSIPGYLAEVTRAEKVTVKARDRRGKEFRVKGTELLARALQHEIDHLNGRLYIDLLDSLDELVRIGDGAEAEVEEDAPAGV